MYFIQGMPFTFDELNDDITSNPEYTAKADRERVFLWKMYINHHSI